jgi:hypothetical protein
MTLPSATQFPAIAFKPAKKGKRVVLEWAAKAR